MTSARPTSCPPADWPQPIHTAVGGFATMGRVRPRSCASMNYNRLWCPWSCRPTARARWLGLSRATGAAGGAPVRRRHAPSCALPFGEFSPTAAFVWARRAGAGDGPAARQLSPRSRRGRNSELQLASISRYYWPHSPQRRPGRSAGGTTSSSTGDGAHDEAVAEAMSAVRGGWKPAPPVRRERPSCGTRARRSPGISESLWCAVRGTCRPFQPAGCHHRYRTCELPR